MIDIIALQKELEEKDEKIKHLEELLQSANVIEIKKDNEDLKDPEFICRTQLKILMDRSKNTELNTDESKRVELYSKLLMGIVRKQEQVEEKYKNVKSEDLLKIISEQ